MPFSTYAFIQIINFMFTYFVCPILKSKMFTSFRFWKHVLVTFWASGIFVYLNLLVAILKLCSQNVVGKNHMYFKIVFNTFGIIFGLIWNTLFVRHLILLGFENYGLYETHLALFLNKWYGPCGARTRGLRPSLPAIAENRLWADSNRRSGVRRPAL